MRKNTDCFAVYKQLSHRIIKPLAASQVASFKSFPGLSFPGINFPGLSFPGLSSSKLLTISTRTSRPTRFLLACSMLSDSGVRSEGREREKNKEEKKEGVPSLSPLPLVVFFFCSNLFALSPRSERLERLGSCA